MAAHDLVEPSEQATVIGKELAHYKILDRLGAGGMGEVFLAEDTKLRRNIALKVLPPDLAADPERLRRFQREAESVATLSHPNIVTIFSVEEDQDVHFITMELVDGETLTDRISGRGMSLREILELGPPIADALAAAHEAGVVHRDLKPANIMIDRRGHVRIMDFGLAKLQQGEGEEASDVAGEALTREGTQLGTVPYMAPEQVQGKAVDQRADIFSLGVVLYEMATGRRPFVGESGPDVMSAILRDDPVSVAELRPDLPRQLGRIIEHCLPKAPDRRFQTALDLRNELQSLEAEIESETKIAGAPVVTERPSRQSRWVLVATLVAVVALVSWWQFGRSGPERRGATTRADSGQSSSAVRTVSQLTFGSEVEEWPAWSPEGTKIVYSGGAGDFMNLWTREIATGNVEQLTDSAADDLQATWSPDGESLLFVRASSESGKLDPDDLFGTYFIDGDVWRLDLETGEETRLIEEAFAPAWSPDGERIAVQAGWAGSLRIWTTDARGRNPRQITSDSSEAVEHAEPSWSPDGNRIVYRRREKSKSDIQVVEIATSEVAALTDDDYRDMNPRFSPDGRWLLFSSYRGGGQNVWRVPIDGSAAAVGPAEQLTTGAGNDMQLSVSPDGTRLGFAVLRINSDVWRLPVDPSTGQPTGKPEAVVATTREDSRGSPSPDGMTLAFNSDRLGDMNLWLRSLEDGSERQLTQGPGGDFQPNWSPDGTKIAFFSSRAGQVDIWAVDVPTGELTQLTDGASLEEDPFFSPDASRIAFQSDADGRLEVWIMNADGTGREQLSHEGSSGHFLRWRADGSGVFHRTSSSGDTNFFLLPVDGSTPVALPEITGSGYHISFSPDRQLIMDVAGHQTLWTFDVETGDRRRVFEFDDPVIRIDYPVWSADGSWVYFDRADYQGGDIWLLEGLD